tara:strand:- start:1912 stop:2154 length:243 start_codon:yes stop_codon:yes gene_type:complete
MYKQGSGITLPALDEMPEYQATIIAIDHDNDIVCFVRSDGACGEIDLDQLTPVAVAPIATKGGQKGGHILLNLSDEADKL